MRKKTPAKLITIKDGLYKPVMMPVRVGSMEILKAPSRIGQSLFYPDGRVTK